MDNKKIILKSNEAHKLITSAIMENRVIEDGKLLTPTEVEELIYYLLEQEYKGSYIWLTKDNEDERQIELNQLRYGDMVVKFKDIKKKDINVEVKSEKPYKNLYYKLRIDLEYSRPQKNTNHELGWAYNIYKYHKIYIHFHDTTSKYKASVYVINNTDKLYMDCMELMKIRDYGTFNINGVWFEVFENNKDRYKTTVNASFDLSSERARERYDIDLIHLEVKL